MIIKAVTARGDAVPMTAEEAARSAIVAALKQQSTVDIIYWADTTSARLGPVRSMNHPDGSWEAWAEGEVPVGMTRTVDDEFFSPKPHAFKVHYRLGKNDLGLPDLKIDSFAMAPVNTNPTQNVGDTAASASAGTEPLGRAEDVVNLDAIPTDASGDEQA